MGSLLPDRSSGVFWQLLLPTYWGGMDLWQPWDLPKLLHKLPEPTKTTMEDYLSDRPMASDNRKLLSKFLSNYSYRGFRLDETEVAAMQVHLEQIIQQLPSLGWADLRKEYDPEGTQSDKTVWDLITKDGWDEEGSIIDILLRPILFKEILLGREKPKPYNTVRLKKRYAKFWLIAYRGDSGLTQYGLETALKTRPRATFYKTAYPEELHFVSDRGYTYTSVLDDALLGMPILRISKPYM